ncbi:uncharacterized protein KY384_003830 [Bacidia gigantensis]|uniref:uncharacterized protein n=1 Tax=Bacidia gigantensis TaxID=2732470 RepID=UPI001D03D6C8|nr:uncharacterized protein KY384_003830 [Bacidia gigantensis]KAG8532189.1 hypothetical protein KY384_003830 [Bacidia gigantensis]
MACSRVKSSIKFWERSFLRSPQYTFQKRQASGLTSINEISEDVLAESALYAPAPSDEDIKSFDPIARAKRRKRQLPHSRYHYKAPRYYRGPLHPHQPPPPSDPHSREFVPGPFSISRLEETYHSTLAPDLLSLLYTHHPPGTLPGPVGQRLRSWDGSSPYHKNRPLRPPRGGPSLRLLQRNITFRNIPRLEKIHVHAFLPASGKHPNDVPVGSMVVQAITGVRATIFNARQTIHNFGLTKGEPTAVGVELRGEQMYDFLAKVVDVVLPKIKDYEGVAGRSGDSSGNINWRLESDIVGLFPEIEINYDAYPPKAIPKIDIICNTTATTDRDARLLLASMGVPFHGKHVN